MNKVCYHYVGSMVYLKAYTDLDQETWLKKSLKALEDKGLKKAIVVDIFFTDYKKEGK